MASDGYSRDALTAAVRSIGQQDLGVDGMHVHVDGRPAVEQRWSADLRRDVFSASKTVTSLAVGIAVGEGLFSLDDPVLEQLGDLATRAADGVETVTIDQLLTMTSGITYRWEDPDFDHPGDPLTDILGTPMGSAPGSTFAYRGANTYVLSRLIRARTGLDLRDYLVPRLFAPLGIANPQWLRCPLGHSLGALGLQLRTEELARITRLLLEGGRWHDRVIVPTEYVTALVSHRVDTNGHLATHATAPHPDNAFYGRHVWLCARDDAWRMDGIYGQFGIVLPHHRACITITGHYRHATADILDAVWRDVVPVLDRSD